MAAYGNFTSILDPGQTNYKEHANNREDTHLSLHFDFTLVLT